MKIVYDTEQHAYLVELEDIERPFLADTDDIAEVRKYFIEHMTFLFNEAVRERFKNKF